MNFLKFKTLQIKIISQWILPSDSSQRVHFTCQHGPDECQGNRAQACALYEIRDSAEITDDQQLAVDVVNCVMGNYQPDAAVPQVKNIVKSMKCLKIDRDQL